ncbi:antibiotic biosynthesis monooxygenase family protein [Hansschlegelia plantiphila]|uniref:Antibiotic biosynthesis monooxygenase n=1 Tax=Hansschlegelia plantiphila TaxID=374655 RepID=A0A9W6MTQ2_9HYPH|nr:antibiotic biosynthesis monooxygenase [Hansschlegelia plantiphila]GLK66579.1 antibiotic biosynthesis monooxygenase [Hansschlegelia plantiphila]
MFVAMNRFKVFAAEAEAFETVWRERDRHLEEVPGFVEFHLLKGPADADTVLYASHTIWRSREDFEGWTRSEAFRKAHGGAGSSKPMFAGHPQFEGFEAVLIEKNQKAAA